MHAPGDVDFNYLFPLFSRNRWHTIHLVRGPSLAQRLLHLCPVHNIVGGPRLHHRRAGHNLPGMCEAEVDVKCGRGNML